MSAQRRLRRDVLCIICRVTIPEKGSGAAIASLLASQEPDEALVTVVDRKVLRRVCWRSDDPHHARDVLRSTLW